jgi:hypothetical protein
MGVKVIRAGYSGEIWNEAAIMDLRAENIRRYFYSRLAECQANCIITDTV